MIQKLIPDTSIIIEGLVSQKIEKKELNPTTIIIHEAVLAELEHQANKGRETGLIGLDEINKLRELQEKYKFTLEFTGTRPGEFEIKHAKSGEIDSTIRKLALDEQGTLITADRVQAQVATAKGIECIFIEFEQVENAKALSLESFFTDDTMSVHIREGIHVFAKRGKPGEWNFVQASDDSLQSEDLQAIAKEIIEEAQIRKDGFIETQRKGSTIVQLGKFRIVLTRPPFSDGYEITAIRPVTKLFLKDYPLSEKLLQRLNEKAEGILIAGSPGMGKSTFVTALAEHYSTQNKIIKTVEVPRDLDLGDNITQYSLAHGSAEEIRDMLLLSRPDYTIYDEMRNTRDFELFTDMRLAGVGMVGIVHAASPVDAIQRFIGRIELGVIPQVIDTVIFIKNGAVEKVLTIKMDVKVPSGMKEADLARPVISIYGFEEGKLEYEAYTYGEQTVLIPVKEDKQNPALILAARQAEKEFRGFIDDCKVEFTDNNNMTLFVSEEDIPMVIGKKGSNIMVWEEKLGVHIDVQPLKKNQRRPRESVRYDVLSDKKNVTIFFDEDMINKTVDISVDNDYLMTVKISKKAQIKMKKDNKIAKIIERASKGHGKLVIQ